MKLIELHILQSFPVSCLNRDDVGSPKSAVFGGVNRARISSQSLKRALREYAKDHFKEAGWKGERTKLIVQQLKDALQRHGITDQDSAESHARIIGDKLAKLDNKNKNQVGTLTFLAPSEIEAIGQAVANELQENPKSKDYEKKLDKICKQAWLEDGVDIALFGRMMASLPSLTLEGAAMFSHALSTHEHSNDLDFYAAVDELKDKKEDAGAGMLGTLEFSSAVYYRYCAVNLDLLFDNDHLGKLDSDERKLVLSSFIRSTLEAIPGARKNSMNAHTRPGFVMGIGKSKGQPLQLVNAFEKPVRHRNGLLQPSVEAMKAHHEEMKKTWGIQCDVEVEIPGSTVEQFTESLLQDV